MPLAALDAALGNRERILIDSSTLIAFHDRLERAHHVARHLLLRISADQDPLHGYYSVISASELLVRPIRTSTPTFTAMHAFLTTFPHLTILPLDLFVAMEAATLRAITNIRLPDALIIASGLLAGCEAIVSNDAQWKRRFEALFPQFQWLYLSDYR
jgi:predicted nucleic acid-binding protein